MSSSWAAALVCDGAGSLDLSHLGAELAVEAASSALHVLLDPIAAPSADELAAAAWGAYLDARDALLAHPDSARMGATLAIALLGAPVRDGAPWAALVVGDSFVVVEAIPPAAPLSAPGLAGAPSALSGLCLLTAPPAGEFANLTRLLTSSDPAPVLASGSGATAATASSDGLVPLALQGPAGDCLPHPGFFTPLHTQAAAGELDLPGLFAHLDALARLDDDTSAAVLALGLSSSPPLPQRCSDGR